MIKILEMSNCDVLQVVKLEEKILGETLGEEFLLKGIINNPSMFLVAKQNDKVIGYISGYFIDGIGEIYNFLVDDIYQRQGIGNMLFDKLMEINKVTSLTLEVRDSNQKGYNFYLKKGFKEISVRKNYYKNGDDAIVMIKEKIW